MINEKLNEELLQIANQDINTFFVIAGVDITRAYVCLLRQQGKSYGEIAMKLNISRDSVIGLYKRNCGCTQPQNLAKVD